MPTARLRARIPTERPADRVLPATHPTRDWETVVEVAWLDALVASYQVVDTERAIVVNDAHQERGRAWLDANGPDHPKFMRGWTKLGALQRRQDRLVIMLDLLLMRCWTACRDLYVAVSYNGRARNWMHGCSPCIDLSSPFTVWRAVAGDRPAPGSWPPEMREHWITRLGHIEVWHLEELRDRYREECTA